MDQFDAERAAIKRIRDRNGPTSATLLAKRIVNADFTPSTPSYDDCQVLRKDQETLEIIPRQDQRTELSVLSVIRRYDDFRFGTQKTLPKSKRRVGFTRAPAMAV